MGEIGELIASHPFSKLMEQKHGKVLRIINGHLPLYTKIFPVENFDEEAQHLDLVAADLRVNLKYWIYGIAEVKSTINKDKAEFRLNGMCPRFLDMAKRRLIPVYIMVVRFPKLLPDDILTDEGSIKTYMEYKDTAKVECYLPGDYKINNDIVTILTRSQKDEDDKKRLIESCLEEEEGKDNSPTENEDDEKLLKRLIDEARREA